LVPFRRIYWEQKFAPGEKQEFSTGTAIDHQKPCFFGRSSRILSHSRYLIQSGGKAFMYATMAQFVVGIWFLASLPRAQRLLFMGDSLQATIPLALGIFGAVAGILSISSALQKQDSMLGLYAGIGITAPVIALMVISRDVLRDSYLQPYLRPMSVKTQWGVFLLFLVVFLSGLLLWLLMIKRYPFRREAASRQPASPGGQMQ
jgi:hypothetical protein